MATSKPSDLSVNAAPVPVDQAAETPSVPNTLAIPKAPTPLPFVATYQPYRGTCMSSGRVVNRARLAILASERRDREDRKQRQYDETFAMMKDFHSQARGSDVPLGKFNSINAKQKCLIITAYPGENCTHWNTHQRCQVKYNCYSQNPSLEFIESQEIGSEEEEFTIYADSIEVDKGLDSFGRFYLDNATEGSVRQNTTDANMPEMPIEVANCIVEYTKSDPVAATTNGPYRIGIVTFRLSAFDGADELFPDTTPLAAHLNQHSAWVMIIRTQSRLSPQLDKYWADLMNQVLKSGAFHHYADFIKEKAPWLAVVPSQEPNLGVDDKKPIRIEPQLWME